MPVSQRCQAVGGVVCGVTRITDADIEIVQKPDDGRQRLVNIGRPAPQVGVYFLADRRKRRAEIG